MWCLWLTFFQFSSVQQKACQISPPPQVRVSRGVSLPVSHSVSHYTNSVLTAQPHWATTGSPKGALGASRAAWRVAIDATLVSFEAPAQPAQTRLCSAVAGAIFLRGCGTSGARLTSSLALATGQTGRPPAHQGTGSLGCPLAPAQLTQCIRMMSTGSIHRA